MAGYGDDEDFGNWLDENGYDLDSNPTPFAVLRQRGSAYVDRTYAPRARGVPTGGFAQERAQPRTGATVNGELIPANVVPRAWVEASYHAALYEAGNPGGLEVVITAAAAIKREKTASLETEYFAGSGDALADAIPLLSAVDGLLAPFLYPAEMPFGLGLWAIGRGC